MTAPTAARAAERATPMAAEQRTLADIVRYFLWLGSTGFGGPIALVGYMHRDLVEKRGWYDEEEYRRGLALAQTMPGPLAAQLAMWFGFLERGALGAGAVACAFVAPPFLIVTAVAVLYAKSSGLAWVHAVFRGVGPVIVAIVAVAAFKLARTTNRRDPLLWLIAAAVCATTVVAGAEIVWLFLAAGAFGALYFGGGLPRLRGAATISPAPLVAAVKGFAVTGAGAALGTMGLFFLQAGAFTFGSGLAIVPFLHEGLVSTHHWLTEQQFVDAVAIGLISPGPVVLTASFGGYLIAGLVGALIATIAVFLPAYVLVVVPGRAYRRFGAHPRVAGFVAGATAAAAGAIAGAAIVIAGRIIDGPAAIAMSVAGLVLLLQRRVRIPEPAQVAAAAAVGLLAFS